MPEQKAAAGHAIDDPGRLAGSSIHPGGLIGLSGLSLSGKSAVSDILAKTGYWHPDGFFRDSWHVSRLMLLAMGYSGPVLDSMTQGYLRDVRCPMFGQSPRLLCSVVSGLFSDHPAFSDIWLRRLSGRVHSIRRAGGNVVLDDLAFVADGRRVSQWGGMRIWIDRLETRVPHRIRGESKSALMEQMYAMKPGPRWHVRNQRQVLVEVLTTTLMDYPSILPSRREAIHVIEKVVDSILVPFFRDRVIPQIHPRVTMTERNADISLLNNGTLADLARSVEDIMASTDLHMVAAATQDGTHDP